MVMLLPMHDLISLFKNIGYAWIRGMWAGPDKASGFLKIPLPYLDLNCTKI